jgi:hypothetical protein
MGWLFTRGLSRKDLIRERTQDWERASGEVQIKSTCLAHCYRGGIYSGVLWAVWERTFVGGEQPTERWITCDLLRYQKDYGWGYKDLDESMFPYFFSCPLKYLDMVPMEQFGGHAEWRECVKRYHAQQAEKRKQRCTA